VCGDRVTPRRKSWSWEPLGAGQGLRTAYQVSRPRRAQRNAGELEMMQRSPRGHPHHGWAAEKVQNSNHCFHLPVTVMMFFQLQRDSSHQPCAPLASRQRHATGPPRNILKPIRARTAAKLPVRLNVVPPHTHHPPILRTTTPSEYLISAAQNLPQPLHDAAVSHIRHPHPARKAETIGTLGSQG
jgi:hypothetical protein